MILVTTACKEKEKKEFKTYSLFKPTMKLRDRTMNVEAGRRLVRPRPQATPGEI